MTTRLFLTLLVFGQLCALALAQERSALADSSTTVSTPIYVSHVTIVDTETGEEIQDRTVIISGDRIEDVRETKVAKVPENANIVNGSGKYLIPGLWDMHVHGTVFDTTLPLYIANGITGVREMFGPPDANKFRAELAAKQMVAPHIYLASPIVDGKPPYWPDSIAVGTPEEARKAVDDQKRKGADFIKIYNWLSRDSYFAIVDESRLQNIPVEGHVPDQISAWEATTAKQKSIEHLDHIPLACSSREEELWRKLVATKSDIEQAHLTLEASRAHSEEKCQRLFVEFKKNGTWPVPTLTSKRMLGWLNKAQFRNDDRVRYFSGEVRGWLVAKDDFRLKELTDADFAVSRELFAYDQKLVGEMFHAGVLMLAGTDAGNPYCFPGFSLHDELALLVESGMSPFGALQAATRNAALFMDATDKYGSVAPGKVADLVLLDADPLKDIHNTTKISAVFLAGKKFSRAALDDLLRKAEVDAKSVPAK